MKSKNLIVYFPGYTGMPKSIINPLLRRFRRDGFATYSVKYNLFGRGDISDLAIEAAKQIDKIQTYKYDTITFIGHSMGGLVARKALCNNPEAADYLITLGTPHTGVQGFFMRFWRMGGRSVGQMYPNSRWLQNCKYPDVTTLTVTGKYDLLVKDGIIQNNPSKNIIVPTTHIGLITGFRTYGEIYSWLVYEQMNSLGRF